MTKPISVAELMSVNGAGVWDMVDKGISLVNHGWNNKACASRGSYIGWGVNTVLGVEQAAVAAAATRTLGAAGGFWAMSAVGPINGLIGTTAYSSYIDNCEKQKARGK